MNSIKNYILLTIAALSLSVVAGSCTQDEFGIEHGAPLPPGEYPLKLTASVEGMKTRTNNTDSWDEGDEIRVRIGDYPWTGRYELNTDGSIKDAIDPLAWPYTDGYVSAWYPYL